MAERRRNQPALAGHIPAAQSGYSTPLDAALRQHGQADAANEVVEGAAQGYDELKTRTDSERLPTA